MTRSMLLRSVAAISASLIVVSAALAADGDGRIAMTTFNPDAVVRITGRQGVQAAITFSEDEHIENVAIGDATAWQVTPNKRANVLFVKPLLARAQTNMTVLTDRHMYLFDLVAGTGAAPVYVMRILDPDYKKVAASRAGEILGQPAMTDLEASAAAGLVKDAQVDPASLNFAWKTKGDQRLMPTRVYDDGQATFIAWLPQTPIPAIQMRNEAGVEGPVNFAVRDDVIVVEGVPDVLILRSGRKVALLERGLPSGSAMRAVAAAAPAPVPAPAAQAPSSASAAATAPTVPMEN